MRSELYSSRSSLGALLHQMDQYDGRWTKCVVYIYTKSAARERVRERGRIAHSAEKSWLYLFALAVWRARTSESLKSANIFFSRRPQRAAGTRRLEDIPISPLEIHLDSHPHAIASQNNMVGGAEKIGSWCTLAAHFATLYCPATIYYTITDMNASQGHRKRLKMILR